MIEIVPLASLADGQRLALADLFVAAFVGVTDSWPDRDAALEEFAEFDDPETFLLVAMEAGQPVGVIGGLPQYDGHVMELHPLAVHPDHQRKGIGGQLVAAFEDEARARGAITAYLGTDDEAGLTGIANRDVFPDPLVRMSSLSDLGGHPSMFYRKHGYVFVGIIPDANGFGKPDLLMAKRLQPFSETLERTLS
jgi:aminoglycoside 6'-N-acetyltransferase I